MMTEYGNVAGQTAAGARNVAQAAKLEAGNVVSEGMSNASGLLDQAKSGVSSQAARPAYSGTEAGGVPQKNLDYPYSEITEPPIKGPSS